MKNYLVILYLLLLVLMLIQPFAIIWRLLLCAALAGILLFIWKRGSFEQPASLATFVIHLSFLAILALRPTNAIVTFLLISFLFYESSRLKAVEKEKRWKQSLEAALIEIDKVNEMFRVVRSQRHDSMKHLNAIHFLLEDDQIAETKQYLDEYIGKISKVSSNLKGEDGHIASVLYQFMQQAKQHEITVALQCQLPLTALPMNHVDQISMIMNLLENSIDAAKEGDSKKITIKTSVHSGIYILEIINTTSSFAKQQQDSLFSKFELTDKGGNHEGLGTWIIKQLVEEYNGVIGYIYTAPLLSIKIKLPIVVKE